MAARSAHPAPVRAARTDLRTEIRGSVDVPDDARLWTLNVAETDAYRAGWCMYYVVVRGDAPELAGVIGYKGGAGEDGAAEHMFRSRNHRGLAADDNSDSCLRRRSADRPS